MMKTRILPSALLFPMLLALSACPYSSVVPIAKPTLAVEAHWLGKWQEFADYEEENPSFYEFKKLDDVRYEVVENTFSASDSAYNPKTYLAHFTEIEQVLFLNMRNPEDNKFYLYKLVKDGPDQFLMFEVTDNIDEQFSNSSELEAFVRKHMNLSFFYNKDVQRFKRIP